MEQPYQIHILTACKFIQKEAQAQMISCETSKTFKSTYFVEHLLTAASDIF